MAAWPRILRLFGIALGCIGAVHGMALAQDVTTFLPENPLPPTMPEFGSLGSLTFENLASPTPDDAFPELDYQQSPLRSPELTWILESLRSDGDGAGLGLDPTTAADVQVFQFPPQETDILASMANQPFNADGLIRPDGFAPQNAAPYQFPLPDIGGGLYLPDLGHGFDVNDPNIPEALRPPRMSSNSCAARPAQVIVVKSLPDHFKVGKRTFGLYNDYSAKLTVGVEIDGIMSAFELERGEFMTFPFPQGGNVFGEVRTIAMGNDRRPFQQGAIYSVTLTNLGKFAISEIRNGNQ
jgi:hypothetical protein